MKTLPETIKFMASLEDQLGELYSELDAYQDDEIPDTLDALIAWKDSRGACVEMVLGQVMEAWTHAGKALKRLQKLQEDTYNDVHNEQA